MNNHIILEQDLSRHDTKHKKLRETIANMHYVNIEKCLPAKKQADPKEASSLSSRITYQSNSEGLSLIYVS